MTIDEAAKMGYTFEPARGAVSWYPRIRSMGHEMSYVVLARKWRPEYFEEVVGQGHVARTLKNSIQQDRVAHAYLFTGARGVGKTSTARILAKALNCHNGPSEKPCYDCPSCKEISSGQAIDVFEIDGASNRGINEIRELREGVRYAPNRDRYKVYIIDEVHMLTTEAFNALLKTLEEPPPHVKFIFATTEPQKIPVTILSRCQRFDFKRISQQDIVEHLLEICPKEGIEAEKAALQLIARQASGGMRDALSLMDQVISFAGQQVTEEQVTQILGVANRKHLFELSKAIIDRDAEHALLALDDVHRYGYDLQQFASEMVTHLRDLMVARVVKNPERVTSLTESELAAIHGPISSTTPDLLHRYFSVMIEGAQEMSRSPYPKLVFEMTLVRMCQLEPLVSIDLLIERLRELEGSLGDEPYEPDPKKKSSAMSVLPARDMPAAPTPPSPAPTQTPSPEPAAPTTPEAASVEASPVSSPPPEPEPRAHVAPPSMPTHKPQEKKKASQERPLWEKPRDAPASAPEVTEATEATVTREPTPETPPTPPEELPESTPGESSEDSAASATERDGAPDVERDAQDDPHNEGADEAHSEGPFEGTPDWVLEEENPEWAKYEELEEDDALEKEPLDRRAEADDAQPASYGIFSLREDQRKQQDFTPLTPDDDEDDEATAGPLTIDIASLGRQEAWRALVTHIRARKAPLAATLEQAYVEEFSEKKLSLTFLERYLHFVHDEKRIEPLTEALHALFGPKYKISIQLRHEAEALPGFETLAQLRESALKAKRDKLARDTQEHPSVKIAEELFQPDAMRVLVALHED